jgi:hypothetical protein
MALHPDLFGPGATGLCVGCQFGFLAFDIAADRYSVLVARLSGDAISLPGFDYIRGRRAVVMTRGEATNEVFEVTSGPVVRRLPDSPISIGADRGGTRRAKLIDDPLERDTRWLLEIRGHRAGVEARRGDRALRATRRCAPPIRRNRGRRLRARGLLRPRRDLGGRAPGRVTPQPPLAPSGLTTRTCRRSREIRSLGAGDRGAALLRGKRRPARANPPRRGPYPPPTAKSRGPRVRPPPTDASQPT